MSALSTTSSFPNTGLVFASELSATHINITRLSLKNVHGSYKNELNLYLNVKRRYRGGNRHVESVS